MMMRTLSLCVALASCATTEAGPQAGVSVDLAAVTLADDCHPVPPSTKIPASPPVPARAPAKPSVAPPADCPAGGCGPSSRSCEQTTMQLAIKSPAGTAATTIKVKKVELLDAKGKFLEELTARSPQKWKTGGTYAAWNESVAGGETLQAMYDLNAPNWGKLTNGRWHAHEKSFQLRVTVVIGTANKTVEKQSITPARLPPPVPT